MNQLAGVFGLPEIPGASAASANPTAYLPDRKLMKYMSGTSKMAVVAAGRALDSAGLGLALTKALVAANRGALQVTSRPGEGTLVEVLFPPTRIMAG